MNSLRFDLEQALPQLERTPHVFATMLRGLPDPWLTSNEGGDTWAPIEVIGHLIHGERTDWIPRARIILDQGESRPFDPYDRLGQRQWLAGKTVDDLLDTFATLRAENLATLRGWKLTAADLDRTGMHPGLGRVTLGQLLAAWVVHDLDHITQVARTEAKLYIAAVGRWTEIMGVLRDRVHSTIREPAPSTPRP
jgi:DinB family protein